MKGSLDTWLALEAEISSGYTYVLSLETGCLWRTDDLKSPLLTNPR